MKDIPNFGIDNSRKETWLVIFSGIRSLFLEELEKNKMSPSKQKRFLDNFEMGLKLDQTVEGRLKCIKEMRKCFSDKNELDHFLYISGINQELPKKPSMRIRKEFL